MRAVVPEELVCPREHRILAFEREAPLTLGHCFELSALEASIGLAQPILQHAFEACLGVALVSAASVLAFHAPLAVPKGVVESDPHERDRRGDTCAAADAVPD